MLVPEKLQDKGGIFFVDDAVLKAEGDIYWECVREFDVLANDLVESENALLTLDLSEADFISSNFIASLTGLSVKAARLGKQITVLVAPDSGWLFELLGEQPHVTFEIL